MRLVSETSKSQDTILWCLKHNIEKAPTAKLRKFAIDRLAEYEAELAKRRVKKQNPADRFANSLEPYC